MASTPSTFELRSSSVQLRSLITISNHARQLVRLTQPGHRHPCGYHARPSQRLPVLHFLRLASNLDREWLRCHGSCVRELMYYQVPRMVRGVYGDGTKMTPDEVEQCLPDAQPNTARWYSSTSTERNLKMCFHPIGIHVNRNHVS